MSERDRYLQGNGVMKNLLGITDARELSLAETAYSVLRTEELLSEGRPHGHFDLEHLKSLHGRILGDVYEWAGTTRGERATIEGETFMPLPLLSKGETTFALAPQVVPYLEGVFRQLASDEYLQGLNRAEFASKAADLFSDINAAHPFREGNGRTQRAFLTELSVQAGHRLDFSVVSQERMIQTSIAGMNGDNAPLRRLFEEISNPWQVRMLQGAAEVIGRMGVDWNALYLATTTPGRPYDGLVAARGPETFILREGDQVLVGQTRDVGREVRLEERVQFTAGPYQGMGLDLEM